MHCSGHNLLHCGRYTVQGSKSIGFATVHSIGRSSHICLAHKIVVLPGDGIGPEIAKVAQRVLQSAGNACGEEFSFQEELIGGAAM